MPDFIPGLKLNELFYAEAVRPLLNRHFPRLNHSAVRLGSGSEVLGYDDATSTDHDWGPHLQLFLDPADFDRHHDAIHEMLRQQLPLTFRGYSTHFGATDAEGTRLLADRVEGPVDHRVELWTVAGFCEDYLGWDATRPFPQSRWLTTPQQLLLGITAGQVYHDGLGTLAPVRQTLAYFPDDIWRYLLLCQWSRIGQEEHFVGRTGAVDDETGSALLAARLVHDIMMLWFLYARRYAPYPKWFGTAFARLDGTEAIQPVLQAALHAANWRERETHLCRAYELTATRHNQTKITPPLGEMVSYFYERPFRVIHADRFVSAIRATITNPAIRALPAIGSIDQFSDNTDLRENRGLQERLAVLYDPVIND